MGDGPCPWLAPACATDVVHRRFGAAVELEAFAADVVELAELGAEEDLLSPDSHLPPGPSLSSVVDGCHSTSLTDVDSTSGDVSLGEVVVVKHCLS